MRAQFIDCIEVAGEYSIKGNDFIADVQVRDEAHCPFIDPGLVHSDKMIVKACRTAKHFVAIRSKLKLLRIASIRYVHTCASPGDASLIRAFFSVGLLVGCGGYLPASLRGLLTGSLSVSLLTQGFPPIIPDKSWITRRERLEITF